MKMQSYDKDLDILFFHTGERTKHSVPLLGGRIIIGFDKNDNIVGLEFMDFMEAVKEHDKKMKFLFERQGGKDDIRRRRHTEH